MRTFENFNELLEVAHKEQPKEGFSATCSNPPYQIESNGQKTHIWHHFVAVGNLISDFSSFIHPVGWIKGGLRMKETKETWEEDKRLALVIYNVDSVFQNVGITDTTITFFKNNEECEETVLRIRDDNSITETALDWESTRFISSNLQEQLAKIAEKVRPEDELNSMSSIIKGKTHFGIVGGRLFKERNADYIYFEPKVGLSQVLAEEKVKGVKASSFYIDVNDPVWETRNKQDMNFWKVVFPATGDTQWRRTNILPPNSVYTGKYVAVFTISEIEAKNVASYVSTDFYHSMMLPLLINHHAMKTTHRNVPKLDFVTGEILDKPGFFINFSNPDTLDDQLATIYNFTQDERDLIEKDLKSLRSEISDTTDI